MLQIRKNVFETNSSSTHSLTICSKDEYQDWVDGKCYWSRWYENFVSNEEVEEKFKKSSYDDFDEYLIDEGLYTFDRYDDIEMETYEESYKTKSGDEIIAFGYYGYDG